MTSGEQDDQTRATQTGWATTGQQPYQPYPPPGYQQPYQPYPPPPPTPPQHPEALVALVLGGVSVVVFPLAGPFAWYFGAKAMREMVDQPGRWSGDDLARIGWVLGIIGTVLLALLVLFFVVFFAVGASMFGAFW